MSARRPPEFTGRLIVRLTPSVAHLIAARAIGAAPAVPDLTSLEDVGEAFGMADLLAFFHGHPGYTSAPAIRGTRAADIAAREARAETSPFPPLHSLLAYFIIDPHRRLRRPQITQVLAELNALPEIELAYREPGLHTPFAWAVDPQDPMVPDQGYLSVAPDGIGANDPQVWGAYSGGGIAFIDLEAGWNLSHVELPRPLNAPQPLFNVNVAWEADHGTAVLGIVLGQPNGIGITGIAPQADFLGVVSRIVAQNQDEWDVASAIQNAAGYLKTGDVLLVEVETSTGYPVETDDLMLESIRLASAADVIVIEAAGNGTGTTGRNLDAPLPATSERTAEANRAVGKPVRAAARTLDRANGGALFVDSGAVLVSACRSKPTTQGTTHRRMVYGGYGSRVDCYAWGENVVTSGYGGFGAANAKNKRHTSLFGGTSAAAAIVAGAAILVQEMAFALRGRRLPPIAMRAMLADPGTGTAVVGTTGSQAIGSMPDLVAIATRLSQA